MTRFSKFEVKTKVKDSKSMTHLWKRMILMVFLTNFFIWDLYALFVIYLSKYHHSFFSIWNAFTTVQHLLKRKRLINNLITFDFFVFIYHWLEIIAIIEIIHIYYLEEISYSFGKCEYNGKFHMTSDSVYKSSSLKKKKYINHVWFAIEIAPNEFRKWLTRLFQLRFEHRMTFSFYYATRWALTEFFIALTLWSYDPFYCSARTHSEYISTLFHPIQNLWWHLYIDLKWCYALAVLVCNTHITCS